MINDMHQYSDERKKREKEHFLRLCEWVYMPQTLEEDDDEDQQSDPNMNQQDGSDSGMDDIQGMDNDANNLQGSDTMGDDSQSQGDDVDPSGMDGGQQQDDPQQDVSQPPMDGQDSLANFDEMGDTEEDDVIDVDDLTKAQEKMNTKVNKVGHSLGDLYDKITSVSNMLQKTISVIDHNNSEIKQFKREFEKRNPTQQEKLELRSLDSAPYSVLPSSYWDKQAMRPNNNYSTEPTEYKLTQGEIDDFNPSEIEKSFHIDDDLRQDINKIFGFTKI